MTSRCRLPILLCLLLTLAGCSSLGKLFGFGGPPKAALDDLKIVAVDDANDGQATELDLVFTYQSDIAATLPKDSPSWFNQRDAFKARYAGDLDVLSLEIPAGFVIQKVALPKRHAEALQVVAYANYVADVGQRPITLTRLRGAVLTLQKTQVVFAPLD